MQRTLIFLIAALSVLACSQSMADDPEPVAPDDAEVYIEVPGGTIAVDEDEAVVDIRVGDVRIYAAEEPGKVDIVAPGFTLRAERK